MCLANPYLHRRLPLRYVHECCLYSRWPRELYIQRADSRARFICDSLSGANSATRAIMRLPVTHLHQRYALRLVPVFFMFVCVYALDHLHVLSADWLGE